MTRHLPRTTIFFPSSCEDIMCGVSLGTLQFTKPPERFHFLHFKDIDGKQKAVFASGRVRDDETAPMNCMAKLVRSDALKTMVMNSEHTVSIGKLFNDVHLPGLHADAKFETVAFDWTEFLSIFFAEEALFCRILSYLVYMHSC